MLNKIIENRLLLRAEKLRSMPYFGPLFAVTTFLIAVLVRFAVADYLPPGFPFLTFFPAVILTGLLGGTRSGFFCAVLSTLAAWHWFIPPVGSFSINFQTAVAVGFFVVVMTVDLLIIHLMNKSIEQLRREKEFSDRLSDRQKTLFQELQHRVANNLAFVSSLLSIHQMNIRDGASAQAAIEDARVRLETMSTVHRRLYDPSNADLPLKNYLDDLCRDILHATGGKNVTFVIEAPDVTFDLEKLMNISLIIVEAVTNSLKHAFKGGRGGQIKISLLSTGGDSYILYIQDSGAGFPAGFDPARSERLGFRILQGFARSLQGELTYANQNGGLIKLAFRA